MKLYLNILYSASYKNVLQYVWEEAALRDERGY
jgi:hypothetical protein